MKMETEMGVEHLQSHREGSILLPYDGDHLLKGEVPVLETEQEASLG